MYVRELLCCIATCAGRHESRIRWVNAVARIRDRKTTGIIITPPNQGRRERETETRGQKEDDPQALSIKLPGRGRDLYHSFVIGCLGKSYIYIVSGTLLGKAACPTGLAGKGRQAACPGR